jgi:hypothetical protein
MAAYNFNAVRHGLYAKHIVLPWENKAEFEELREALLLEYEPDGISQREAIENLAALFWRKRRCALIMRLLYSETPYGRLIEEVGRTEPDAIRRHLDKEKAEDARRVKRLRKSIKELGHACAELAKRPQGKKALPNVALRRAEDLLQELRKMQPAAEATLTSETKPGEIAPTTLELVEKASSAEARLDSQITKQIQQLIILKEFAKMYRRPVAALVEHFSESKPPSSILTIEAESSLKTSAPGSTIATAAQMANPNGGNASHRDLDLSYDNDNNDNNDDNDDNDDNDNNDDKIDPEDFDWEWEYDEALAKGHVKRKSKR